MLGVMLVRSATIEAETICSMWEITQEQALIILERLCTGSMMEALLLAESSFCRLHETHRCIGFLAQGARCMGWVVVNAFLVFLVPKGIYIVLELI